MKNQKLTNSNETKSIETQTGSAGGPATHVGREPTKRILHIHELVAAGKCPNTTTLAHEFGISTRTVLRDLDYMRDKFRLPLEYDRQNFGFRYTEPVKHPPGMAELSEREMFALLVADKLVAQYRGTPFGAHLDDAFRRVACYLSPEQRYSIEGLVEALSIRPFAPDEPDMKTMLRTVFRVMHEEKDYEVVVEFDAWATDVMQGRQLRSVQKTEPLPGGGSRVTLRVSCLEEVRRWVLEWEEHATVIAPEELKLSLEKIGWGLVDKYNREVEELAA